MYKTTVLLCSLTLCLALVLPTYVHAQATTRVLSETNGEIIIEFLPEGSPLISKVVRFFVALSPQGSYNVQELGSESGSAVGDTRDASAELPIIVSPPFMYRDTRVISVQVRLQADPVVVAVTYQSAAQTNDWSSADPLLRNLIENRDFIPARPVRTRPDPQFSYSPNWVKIRIEQRAVYAISGAQLAAAGVPLGTITDSDSFRMFTGSGVAQPRGFNRTEGSWRAGQGNQQVAILVEDGGDLSFDPGDRIIFYALGSIDWLDYYQPGASESDHNDHPYDKAKYYYLTWDGAFQGGPKLMSEENAAPVVGPTRGNAEHRIHAEEDRIINLDFGDDGFLWQDVSDAGTANLRLDPALDIEDLVTSQPQRFETIAIANFSTRAGAINSGHHAVYRVGPGGNMQTVTEHRWDGVPADERYENGRPVLHEGFFLNEGANTFWLGVPRDDNIKDFMYFAWFSVAYQRRLIAHDNRHGFTSPDSLGAMNFAVRNLTGTDPIYAFDVTDQVNVKRLQGFSTAVVGGGRQVTLGAMLDGTRRHFWVATSSGLRSPAAGAIMRHTPSDLRNPATPPNMIIVTDKSFRSSADLLRAHHSSNLPYFPNPGVLVVTTEEIYDNFSGGQRDPMGIRNYLKFLYDNFSDGNGNPQLSFLCLLGDANYDSKNVVSQLVDFVPTHMQFFGENDWTFAVDDWYGHLDSLDVTPGFGVTDLSLGRLPAASPSEAAFVVNKAIGYDVSAPLSDWRSQVILVADDEKSAAFPSSCDVVFTSESEFITYLILPQYIDTHKIYLTEFPRIANIKPSARFTFLEEWSRGALIVNYIGHGSSQQMADEQVFLGSDVSLLTNGEKLPLLMAFSCTIGDFANPLAKSLSEKLIFREGGGVIGTITASEKTFPGANERFNYALFRTLMPKELGTVLTMGEAMQKAKLVALVDAFNHPRQEDNSWKYNLLTDPALQLKVPQTEIRFDRQDADTLVAGLRKTIRGKVYRDGVHDAGFSGDVLVKIREPDIRRAYELDCDGPGTLFYRVAGGVLYEGTTEVTGGEFAVNVRVPRYARTGRLAFVTAYANDSSTDALGTADSMLTLMSPSLGDSTALQPVDGAPRVQLGFRSGLTAVKSGQTLRATVRDADGINILNTTNEGKHAIVFDDTAVPIDVTEFFSFDHGGTDTSGVLSYRLPDLSVGQHQVIYKVSDSFGQTRLDTLNFTVTDSLLAFAEVMLNYPNPFRSSTQFLINLSDAADIRLDIFTLSGRRLRRLEDSYPAGPAWVKWDGRDAVGDEIANGTYLYVARVNFTTLDRSPLTLRGKVSRIR